MAPKPGPNRRAFGMALAMALTILAITMWARPNWAQLMSEPIYRSQLLLLY
jgi:hypothetical protein